MSYNQEPGYLPLSGGTMTGNLILNADPVTSSQAANKSYVDMIASGLNIQGACYAATTAELLGTYANGTSGVGATLTNAGALAAFSVDGVSPALNSRILVKDQSSELENGIYVLTTVGSGAVAWVLTRATDYDTPAEVQPGDFVVIQTGTINAHLGFVQTATVATIGVDAIEFVQFGTTNASTATIVNDTTTNATMYPTWVTANSGTLPLNVTSTKLSFNPSTGALSSTQFLASSSVQSDTLLPFNTNGQISLLNQGSSTAGDSILLQSTNGGVAILSGLNLVSINSGAIFTSGGALSLPYQGLATRDSGGTNKLTIQTGSAFTTNRALTLTTGDADRTITLSGNPTLSDWFDQSVKTTASPTFASVTFRYPTTDVTGTSQTMSVNNAYIANNAGLVTLTLPATAAVGDIVSVSGQGAGGWRITQSGTQTIHLGSATATGATGGYLEYTNQYDSITLRCVVANTTWNAVSVIGNITVT